MLFAHNKVQPHLGFEKNWSCIRTHANENKQMSTYTIFNRLKEEFNHDFSSRWGQVFNSQTTRLKINDAHHFILRYRETQELRFYQLCLRIRMCVCVLDTSRLINNRTDFDNGVLALNNVEVLYVLWHFYYSTEKLCLYCLIKCTYAGHFKKPH